MLKRIIKSSIILMATLMILVSCASVNYVGKTLEETQKIEVFYSADEIGVDYNVIGHALGLGLFVNPQKIQKKLVTEARAKGADAILISGIGKGEVIITTGMAAAENQLHSSFLKYK